VAYPEVAIETLVLADESRARTYVRYMLGALAGKDATTLKLRETLRVYSLANQNASLAALQLGIAARTVRYRLRVAQDRLGNRKLMDVALAMRVEDALESQGRQGLPIVGDTPPAGSGPADATPYSHE
jgi:DNA-binding PucR family transcriptional regulator